MVPPLQPVMLRRSTTFIDPISKSRASSVGAAGVDILQLDIVLRRLCRRTRWIAIQLESKNKQKSGSADNSPIGHLKPSPSNNQNVPRVSSMSPAPSFRNTSGNRRKYPCREMTKTIVPAKAIEAPLSASNQARELRPIVITMSATSNVSNAAHFVIMAKLR